MESHIGSGQSNACVKTELVPTICLAHWAAAPKDRSCSHHSVAGAAERRSRSLQRARGQAGRGGPRGREADAPARWNLPTFSQALDGLVHGEGWAADRPPASSLGCRPPSRHQGGEDPLPPRAGRPAVLSSRRPGHHWPHGAHTGSLEEARGGRVRWGRGQDGACRSAARHPSPQPGARGCRALGLGASWAAPGNGERPPRQQLRARVGALLPEPIPSFPPPGPLVGNLDL